MRGFSSLAALAILLFSLSLPPAPVLAETAAAESVLGQRDVEEGLTCQCGCGLTVAACNHLECSFAVPVRKDIAESLARGESGEQILERYKREYGEKVLSSPVPEGFNILAWVAPYLGIFIAGSLMFTFFRRRALRAPVEATTAPLPTSRKTDERIARLQDEVEESKR